MINFKQRELSQMLFDKLKQKFPELELLGIMEGPENPNHIWVRIIMPEDEDRAIEAQHLASEISSDILMDYGYLIIISAATPLEKQAA